jgi:hypothetical protein
MKKLTPEDLLDIAAYEKVRDERLEAVIRLKRLRRVQVGPMVSLVFENRETMRSQIQEMMRAERLVRDEAIQEELDVYNDLIPGDGELSATLYIEVDDPARVVEVLDRFLGLDEDERVFIRIDGRRVAPGIFEKGRSREDRISAVHFVKFRFDEAGIRAFRADTGRVDLVIRHSSYEAEAEIAGEIRRSLAEDFA